MSDNKTELQNQRLGRLVTAPMAKASLPDEKAIQRRYEQLRWHQNYVLMQMEQLIGEMRARIADDPQLEVHETWNRGQERLQIMVDDIESTLQYGPDFGLGQNLSSGEGWPLMRDTEAGREWIVSAGNEVGWGFYDRESARGFAEELAVMAHALWLKWGGNGIEEYMTGTDTRFEVESSFEGTHDQVPEAVTMVSEPYTAQRPPAYGVPSNQMHRFYAPRWSTLENTPAHARLVRATSHAVSAVLQLRSLHAIHPMPVPLPEQALAETLSDALHDRWTNRNEPLSPVLASTAKEPQSDEQS